jgi:hypothetical protein
MASMFFKNIDSNAILYHRERRVCHYEEPCDVVISPIIVGEARQSLLDIVH